MSTGQSGYKHYAQVYDEIQGDRTPHLQRVQTFLHQYAPEARTVLELACGTGSIMQGLSSRYVVAGLDNSEDMLRVARKRLPQAELYLGDMTDFNFGRTYDAVLCMFNSVDHLPTFEEWQRFFAGVADHLRPGGLFVFDTNSLERYERLSEGLPWAVPMRVRGSETVIDVQKTSRGGFVWQFGTRQPLPNGDVGFVAYEIHTTTFPEDQIREELSKSFEILEVVTEPGDPMLTDDAGKMYYACIKKPDGR